MQCSQEIATRQLLVGGKFGVSVVVVSLFISDWCVGLLEENFIWTERLLGALDIRNVSDQTRLRDSSFGDVSFNVRDNYIAVLYLLRHRKHLSFALRDLLRAHLHRYWMTLMVAS